MTADDLLQKLVTGAVVSGGTAAFRAAIAFLAGKVSIFALLYSVRRSLLLRVSIYLISVTFVVYILPSEIFGWTLDKFFLAVLCIAILLLWDVTRYALVGFQAAEPSVRGGTNYEMALRLVRSELWFLGTGASKLTSSSGFEAAVARCSHGNGAVRFLLSPPNNLVLQDAEKRARATNTSYVNKVKESLHRLRSLKMDRAMNIEVRFYPASKKSHLQNFRMMFINGDTLLLSYNVYGGGDGSNAPQVVISKSSYGSAKDNFFYPHHSYFENLWQDSKPWDFQEFLD